MIGSLPSQARAQMDAGSLRVLVLNQSAGGRPARRGSPQREVIGTLDIAGDETTLTHAVALGAGQWVHVRLRDAKGITAFVNPIYGAARSDQAATFARRPSSKPRKNPG